MLGLPDLSELRPSLKVGAGVAGACLLVAVITLGAVLSGRGAKEHGVATTNIVSTPNATATPSIDTAGDVTVSSISPTSGATGGGTVVDIHGTGFTSGTLVRFGSALSARVTFVTSTEIRAVAPRHPRGLVQITARNAGLWSGPAPQQFDYVVVPRPKRVHKPAPVHKIKPSPKPKPKPTTSTTPTPTPTTAPPPTSTPTPTPTP